ncbi:uncharacterized protein LOC114278297 isoform X2 [Camellia sinensis]|uniref:uncharacterized protein LOC114278297 isoform X2 n=1 Tax=Camellia sinensis TaxID=4442 RepID=UPI0010360A47|nr:uncharacterized protein LOC114278297 isoform X2 [Camellia sinensis]
MLLNRKNRSIDIESICQLLDLVLGSQSRAQVNYFVEYLRTQIDYKVINIDQWMGFYRFCNEGTCRVKMKQLQFMGIACTVMLFIVYRTTNYQYRQTAIDERLNPFYMSKFC